MTTTISALTAASALAGTEVFPADQAGSTVKVTANQIKTFIGVSPLEVTDGTTTVSAVTEINFTGGGATVSSGGTGIADVAITPGGGGGGGGAAFLRGDVASAQLAHLYWRINILTSAFGGNTGFAELSMAATSGGSNELTGGTPTAIGSDSGYGPGNAVDSNTATAWNYAGSAGWWQYQFASAVKVLEVKITARTDAPTTSPSTFQLEFSDDGVTFGVLQSFTATLPWTTGQVQTFAVATAPIGGGSSTVAALPASPAQGDRSFVTDATATTFLSTVAGGGSDKVPVVYDGTNWVIG